MKDCDKYFWSMNDLADHMYIRHRPIEVTAHLAALLWKIYDKIYHLENEFESSKAHAVVEMGQSLALYETIEELKQLVIKK